MTEEQLREIVLRTLGNIAPDVDLESVEPNVPFRDQFDFDSMDCLNFVTALHKECNIDIPEKDYPKLATLEGCIAYLQARQS